MLSLSLPSLAVWALVSLSLFDVTIRACMCDSMCAWICVRLIVLAFKIYVCIQAVRFGSSRQVQPTAAEWCYSIWLFVPCQGGFAFSIIFALRMSMAWWGGRGRDGGREKEGERARVLRAVCMASWASWKNWPAVLLHCQCSGAPNFPTPASQFFEIDSRGIADFNKARVMLVSVVNIHFRQHDCR